jgi:hypothetical protein
MKKLKSLLITCLVGLSLSSAQAGLLVEPLTGFSVIGNVTSGSGEYDQSSLPVVWGARFGYSFLGLMGGIDYQKVTGIEFDVPSSTSSNAYDLQKNGEYDITETSLFVGYDFPILVRGWAAYIVNAKMEASTNASYEDASGFKYGFGFTGLPFVSLNLEHKVINFDTAIRNGISTAYDVKVNYYTLTLSLPLDL